MCPALTTPTNGQVSYDMTSPYGIGTVARFICNAGFSLNGAVDMLTCADDDQSDTVGTWGGTEPTCPREFIITSNKNIDNVMLLGMARETTQKYMNKGMALVQAFLKSQNVLFANYMGHVYSVLLTINTKQQVMLINQ